MIPIEYIETPARDGKTRRSWALRVPGVAVVEVWCDWPGGQYESGRKYVTGGVELHRMRGVGEPDHRDCALTGGACWHDGSSQAWSCGVAQLLIKDGEVTERVEAEIHAILFRWAQDLTPEEGAVTVGTLDVLAEVRAERAAQDRKWGEQNHADHPHTGPSADAWAALVALVEAEARASLHRGPTWAAILLEEVGEALQEDDPARLRAELVQVAAVAVAWVEAIDRRGGAR